MEELKVEDSKSKQSFMQRRQQSRQIAMPTTKLDSTKQEIMLKIVKSSVKKLNIAQQHITRINTNLRESQVLPDVSHAYSSDQKKAYRNKSRQDYYD